MTDNDYIAEYVKERYPHILGVDYGLWKAVRIVRKTIEGLAELFDTDDGEVGEQDDE